MPKEGDSKYMVAMMITLLFVILSLLQAILLHQEKIGVCKSAGISQIRSNDFRHSCASLLVNNGANITVVT